MKSIFNFFNKQKQNVTNTVFNYVPGDQIKIIFEKMSKTSIEQAKERDLKVLNSKISLYDIENRLFIDDDVNRLEINEINLKNKNAHFRINGYLNVEGDHASDVMCKYYPATKKIIIIKNGING